MVGGDVDSKFEEYEPRSAAWRELPPIPTQRSFAAAAAVGARIYVMGGIHAVRTAVAVVEEFDLVSRTWRSRANLPSARSRFAAVAAGGKILVFGGYTENGDISDTDIYDPARDSWAPGPPLPLARHGHAAVHVDGTVFVLGGYASVDGALSKPQSRVDALNLTRGTWEARAALPTARGFFAAVVVDHWLYAIGGRLSTAPIERYSSRKNTWEAFGAMPAPRERFGAALVNGRITVVGGEGNSRDALSYDPRCKGQTQARVPTSAVALGG